MAKVDEGKLPVVGIGASIGRMEAMELFFTHLPTDTCMAFDVVPHQHPEHTCLLPELPGRKTDLPVDLGEEGTPLQSDHVSIGPPGGHLGISTGLADYVQAPEAMPKQLVTYAKSP